MLSKQGNSTACCNNIPDLDGSYLPSIRPLILDQTIQQLSYAQWPINRFSQLFPKTDWDKAFQES